MSKIKSYGWSKFLKHCTGCSILALRDVDHFKVPAIGGISLSITAKP